MCVRVFRIDQYLYKIFNQQFSDFVKQTSSILVRVQLYDNQKLHILKIFFF